MKNAFPSKSTFKDLSKEELESLSLRTSFALSTTGIGVWDYSTESQELIWDESMLNLYGLDESTFNNRVEDWIRRIHPDDQDKILDAFNASIQLKQDFNATYRIPWPNGVVHYIEAKGRMLLDAKGQVFRMIGTNADITERKLAEQEIRKLSTIARQTDNVVVITNIAGEIEWVNEAFTKCSGYLPEEVMGRRPGDFLQGPETNPDTVIAIGKALSERRPCQFEIINYTKTGKTYWIELRINPILDENGQLQGFMALEMDVSQRKNTETQLMRQQDMLESMSRQGSIGAWELDLVKEKIYWSEMTKKIHEVPADFEPNLETGINFYKEGHSRDTISSLVAQAIEDSTPWNEELQLITAKGNEIWVNATGQAEFKDGKCIRLYGSFQDIQERKRIQEELTKSKEIAESAAKTKSQFLASMSHEIRTPMNGVLGMLGLMMQDNLNPKQLHRAKLAKSSAESLLTIINEILDFSKIEAGKIELELIDFNLHTLLAEFAETMAHRLEDKNIEIILDSTNIKTSMVRGDPGRIRQILTNLVGNALKFTKEGEILIRASLAPKRNQLYTFECDIEDTGIGIESEKLSTLFQAFSQVDASTTRKYGGTGLGLSIVKELCRLMNGDISVSSVYGEGSCFSVKVELMQSDVIQAYPAPNIQNNAILVIDTNTNSRHVIRTQLEQWGALAFDAENASKALALMASHRIEKHQNFQQIIIDSKLSDMELAELTSIIKSYPGYDKTQLILMTDLLQEIDRNSISKMGFDAALPKPATRESLSNAISICLNLNNVMSLGDRSSSHELDNSLRIEVEKSNLTGARILVVEDNFINQEVAKGMLESMGILCDLASNGQEAIEALLRTANEARYDLIIMDCQMPEMDGYEASRQIRAGKGGEIYINIPIIAITANAIKGDKEICLAAGMNDYLSKPLNSLSLKTMLANWLKKPNKHPNKTNLSDKPLQPNPISKNRVLNNSSIWDLDDLSTRLNLNTPLIELIIKKFLEDLPDIQEQIHDALNSGNFEAAGRLAHSLKGSSSNLSAYGLANQAAELEVICKEENSRLIHQQIENFDGSCREIQAPLRNYLDNISNN